MQLNSVGRKRLCLCHDSFFEQTTSLGHPCLTNSPPLSLPSSASTNGCERAHNLVFSTFTLEYGYFFLFHCSSPSHTLSLSPSNSSLLATSLLLIPRIDGLPHRLCQVDPVQGHPGQGDPALPLQHWRESRLVRFHHLGTPQGHKESTERLHFIALHSSFIQRNSLIASQSPQHGDLTVRFHLSKLNRKTTRPSLSSASTVFVKRTNCPWPGTHSKSFAPFDIQT